MGTKKETIIKYVGMTIRGRRLEMGITQRELADMIGLKRTSITNIESGKQRVTLPDLYRLALALEISVSELLPDVKREQYRELLRTDIGIKKLKGVKRGRGW